MMMENIKIKRNFFEENIHVTKKIANGFRSFLGFSFAREKCLCCNRQTFSNPICPSCRSDLFSGFQRDFSKRCSVCGKILLSEKGICTKCRSENLFSAVDQVLPMFMYRLWIKRLVYQWKIGNRRTLSPVFARLFNEGLKVLGETKDSCVLVPVPPRPGKIKKRGWDQVDELCSFLHKDYGYYVLPVLRRFTHNQQKKLDREERLIMRGKNYGLCRNFERKIENWSVVSHGNKETLPSAAVIIDDVITTGITVASCAEILKKIGIATVKVLSLVIVD